MKKIEIIKGSRFGKLTIISECNSTGKSRIFLCKCDCGKETIRTIKALLKKSFSSCGCFQKEFNNSPRYSRRTENHGHLNTRLYSIWSEMKKRCYNKNSRAFKWYGEKGVTICNDWNLRFLNFYNWAINNGYNDNLTIDRIDFNGNYEPNNCRWVDMLCQNNNKSNNRIENYNGKNLTIAQISKITSVGYTTIISRLNRGLTIYEATL
ncbi:hypothetical protein OX284_010055 [Flavobacterium sp. SUN046]|uniref:hypothetical protein n=1 Tax=Flavobacterium sp. SUN046 TaxID=3002440 RepID=UPI002DBF5C0E|nr:hypothetical protein [Flavobacterium sp. SUN046]MEC4049770.1 hypothetical protein [Flavobacterium sp. SUN046]